MSEREADVPKHPLQNIKPNHPSMMSLMVSLEQKLQNSNSLMISREALPPSSNCPTLSRTIDSTNSSYGLEFQVKCCCDGGLHLSESTRQPFCGWEQKSLPFTGSTHIVFAQNSNQSLESTGSSHRSANGASTKSKCSIYQSTNHKRTDFRCHIRSHMHSSDSKPILYEFEHHTDRDCDISPLYIDKYRKSITYPKMEQKSLPLTSSGGGVAAAGCGAGGELSLWSPLGSRCGTSSVLKPKLFVLGECSTAPGHARPFTCRKNYAHGAGYNSTPESKPKFRLSDLTTASTSSDKKSRAETVKKYPVPIVSGFSSMLSDHEPTRNKSSTEVEFVGAEEESDALELSSMTWVSAQSLPESYLISSVAYPTPSNIPHHSIPRKRAISASSSLSKNPSTISSKSAGFRGSMNVNPFRSLTRGQGPGATLLAMAGKKSQTFSRNGATTKNLVNGFQLSSYSMPVAKSGEKTVTKSNNRLGHLLRRKHRTDRNSFRNPHGGEADTVISAHGVY